MRFPDDYLDRLRATVRVSEVVGRKWRLRRQGQELVVIDNPSFSVNDKKGMWKEFGNGGPEKGGDIFKFLQDYEGFTFVEAVKEISDLAGIPIPRDDSRAVRGPARSNGSTGTKTESGVRVIVGQWDYVDANGRALYQTVRVQWKNSDGTWRQNPKTGKAEKSFYQRRRSPDVDGTWVNGLSFIDEDGERVMYMRKGAGSDWTRFDEKKYREWSYTEKADFARFGNIDHTLLGLPAILRELQEERQEQRTIFIPEGEKKVDLLTEWGCVATCNSGGAGNWHKGMADLLADAADIVILEDNDEAGQKRTLKMAPMLQAAGCRVRVLPILSLWPEAPLKADVVDWAERGGGNEALLLRAVERIPEWAPPPYRSQYGAQSWGTHRDASALSYEWQVKGIIPAGHNVLIMGPSGSGKSFETTALALAVARGVDYNGRKVKRAGVVYLNYEGRAGMSKRILAYEQHHGLHPDEVIPFAWMTRPPGLYASEESATSLAADIKEVTRDWQIPVGVIVVDTHNAATRGSSEIKTEDVSRIMDRYAKVQAETGASIWIVGHTNAAGEHRGNEVLSNNIETTILIEKVRDGYGKNAQFVRDLSGDPLRRVTVKKQREGADGVTWDFVLRSVELGRDDDGDPITSMVPVKPNLDADAPNKPRRHTLSRDEKFFMMALRESIGEWGVPPPADLKVSHSVALIVEWMNFASTYDSRSLLPADAPEGDVKKHRHRRQNLGKDLVTRGLISVRMLNGVHYLWPLKSETPTQQPTEGNRNADDNSPVL